MYDVIIVGSGVAAHSAARELARIGPDLSVRVLGEEVHLPYDRPLLSKQYLVAEEIPPPDLGGIDIYSGNLQLSPGAAVVGIDRRQRSVTTAAGETLFYDKLLLATGSRLRRLPLTEEDCDRVLYLRTVDDAKRLRQALRQSASVMIVGGGALGLEVAAAARGLGCAVTILKQASGLMSRAASPALSKRVLDLHSARGVETRFGASVEKVIVEDGGLTVCTDDGSALATDLVVVAAGVKPNVEVAEKAGIFVDDGIHVDCHGQTSDSSIFAAGEVTNYPIGMLGLRARTECWSTAVTQATAVVSNMVGTPRAFNELPWFWTDQYEFSIQCVGLMSHAESVFEVGNLAEGSWLQIGRNAEGRFVGAEAINAGRQIAALRRADRNQQPIPADFLKWS